VAKNDLEFVGLRNITQELNENRRWVQLDPPRTVLVVATPSGRIREIPLANAQLSNLLRAAATIAGQKLDQIHSPETNTP